MDVYTPRQQTFSEEQEAFSEKGMDDIRKRLLFDVSPLDKNDTILNHLHSSKQPVQVYLRIRPKSAIEVQSRDPNCLYRVSDTNLLAIAPQPCRIMKGFGRGQVEHSKHFYFTHIYEEDSTQSDIFSNCVLPLLEDFFDGQNCLLFSYGVTNSGKSYTITGTGKEPGVLPRALDVIFNSIKDHHFEGLVVKPKFCSEATYLSEAEQEKERIVKESLLRKASSTEQAMSSYTLPPEQPNTTLSCLPSDDNSNVISSASSLSDLTADTSSLSSNISKMTCEAGSIGASMFEELTVHEEHTLEVDTCDNNLFFSIWVSFAEIYNEFIYDLLAEPVAGKPRPSLKLSEDRNRNPYIKDLREIKVDSTEEALKLLKVGLRHRHIAGTKLNYQSSRSHAIFTIKIIRIVKSSRRPRVTRISRMSIVDLAGSERSKKTGATGDRCKEAGSINNSLHVLGRCIEAMRQNQKVSKKSDEIIVPFRDSKLTKLLQTFFAGKGKSSREGKVVMILNVSNNASVFNETAHVLKFSALASKVVPTNNPAVRALMSIPKLSPMKPVEEEEETSEKEEEGLDEMPHPLTNSVGVCDSCELLKLQFEKAKKEVVDLKMQLWEQENKIRQQVSQEYNQQLVEIQDRMDQEIEEHEALLEQEVERRMIIFQKSTKKHYSRKRRRHCPEEEEEERLEQLKELEALREAKTRLMEELEEVEEELEMERKKNACELKDFSSLYESKLSNLRSQYNQSMIEFTEMKKRLQTVEKERKEQEEGWMARVEKLSQQLKAEDKKESERAADISLLRDTIAKLEESLRLKEEAAQEKEKETKERLEEARSSFNNLRAEFEAYRLEKAKEIEELRGSVESQQLVLEERDQQLLMVKRDGVAKLKREREELEREQGRVNQQIIELEKEYSALEETKRRYEREMRELEEKVRVLEGENEQLRKTEVEYDVEKEELLLQIVSLETSGNRSVSDLKTLHHGTQTNELFCNTYEPQVAQEKNDLLAAKCDKEVQLRVSLEEEVSELKSRVEKFSSKEKKLTEQLKNATESLAEKEEELRGATDKQRIREEEFRREMVENQEVNGQTKARLASLEEEINKTERELSLEKERRVRGEIEVKKLLEENRELSLAKNSELSAYEKLVREKDRRAEELLEDLEKARSDLKRMDQMRKTVAGLEEEIQEKERVSRDTSQRLFIAQAAISRVETTIRERVACLDQKLQKTREDVHKKAISLQERVSCRTDDFSALRQWIDRSNETIRHLQYSVKQHSEQIASAETNAEEKERERNNLVRRVAELEEALKEKAVEVQRLEKGGKESLQKLLEVEGSVREKEDQLEKMKVAISALTSEKAAIMRQLREKEEDFLVGGKLQKSTESNQSSPRDSKPVVYDVPPDATEEHVYDSIHVSLLDTVDTLKKEDPLDETRLLPLLERSSMLRDSLEDFNSPMSRKITFNPLKDVRRPKKPKGRATRKKAKEVKTEATEEEMSSEPTTTNSYSTSNRRYMLRSRKKKQTTETDTDNDENVPPPPSSPVSLSRPASPLFSKMFRGQKKAQTTVKRKRAGIRKSQISGPVDLDECDPATPENHHKAPLNKLGHSLKPVRNYSKFM